MDPLKRIHFQRASSATLVSSVFKRELGETPGSLSGREARDLYEEVLSQPSKRSQPKKSKRRRMAAQSGKNGANSPRSSKRKREDTKPNDNLLLLYAQEGNLTDLKKMFRDEDTVHVNASDRFKWTALMCAACAGHLEIVQFLLEMGADYTLTNDRGQTAYDLARNKRLTRIMRILGKAVQDPDTDGQADAGKNSRSKRGEVFCPACRGTFENTTMAEHQTSTVHLFNTQPKEKGTWYHLNESNRGYQMLVQDGWDKDRGLGPEGKEGLKFPVKTVLKRDRKCLGAVKDRESRPRVTHFKPYDLRAVKRPKPEKKPKEVVQGSRISRKQQERDKRKKQQWEIDFRRSFTL